MQQPRLGIYPTADGYRLVWKVAKFSTNPFGLYLIAIDAHTGEIVSRKDFVNFQQAPRRLPLTADIYPKYPTITRRTERSRQSSASANGTPCGQERVTLRSFDQHERRHRLERHFDRNARARQQRSGDQTAVRAGRARNVAFPQGQPDRI